MIFLIFSIAASVGILIVFKISGRIKIPALEMVLVNYIVASVFSFSLLRSNFTELKSLNTGFFIFGSIIGFSFVLMFLFIEYSITKTGISKVSSATKLSVALPILMSILIDPNDVFSIMKGFGMLIMFVALVLLMINIKTKTSENGKILIPLFLFLGMGSIDSIVKYSQQYFVPQGRESIFSLYVFLLAFFFAFIIALIQKKIINVVKIDVVAYGSLLGVFNFGSLYFLLKALNLNLNKVTFLDSSRILMFNNIGIVLASVIIGVFFYKEKLSVYNYFGILLSVIGFYFLI
jgi:drug/metabolite transporter (DMT)-like permease